MSVVFSTTCEPALDGHLLPKETIAWSGRPSRWPRFGPFGFFFVPVFALWWVGYAQNWQVMQPAVRLAIAAAAILLVITSLLVAVVQQATTVYAVTDRRVLMVRSRLWPEITALPLCRLPEMTLQEEANGRGTIRFGQGHGPLNVSGKMPRFVGIADARRVHGLIERAAAQQR